MTKKKDVYEIVNARIIEALEKGIVPWKKPWKIKGKTGLPTNYSTGKPYNGYNVFNLSLITLLDGYTCNKWITRKQAIALGGKVKEKQYYHPVIYWNFIEKEKEVNGEIKKETIPFLRFYQVYNLDQIEGIDYTSDDIITDTIDFKPIEECEKISLLYHEKPSITHCGNSAFYQPSGDYIQLPEKKWFRSETEYYSTLFHEYVHSTGHKKRLNRPEIVKIAAKGSATYSKEELTAELGGAFLCGIAGIENDTIENSAAYIGSWLRVLKDNKTWLVSAAGKAQKAVDYILSE